MVPYLENRVEDVLDDLFKLDLLSGLNTHSRNVTREDIRRILVANLQDWKTYDPFYDPEDGEN